MGGAGGPAPPGGARAPLGRGGAARVALGRGAGRGRAARAPWRGGTSRAVAVGVAALALGGCGSGIVVQDDFYVQRSGSVPGAALTLVVNDAGTATCNRSRPVPISDPQLIQARYIQTTIAPQAQQGVALAAGPRPVFHYAVRTPDGHVSFYDDSRHLPSIFGSLALLTLQIAQQDCHLAL